MKLFILLLVVCCATQQVLGWMMRDAHQQKEEKVEEIQDEEYFDSPANFKLVAQGTECNGAEKKVGYRASPAACAQSCSGKSSMFAFGTNNFGTIRCRSDGHCWCYCETASANGVCTGSLSKHNGYNLYRFTGKAVNFGLVATASECNGAETNMGYAASPAYCARRCSGKSSMFVFGTNKYGTVRCNAKGHCMCYCETASADGKCHKRITHKGYNLYKYNSAPAYSLVATGSECNGAEKYIGYVSGPDVCARACSGKASMFVYGTNRYGYKRCSNGKCACYCETASNNGKCNKRITHKGYNLYRYNTGTGIAPPAPPTVSCTWTAYTSGDGQEVQIGAFKSDPNQCAVQCYQKSQTNQQINGAMVRNSDRMCWCQLGMSKKVHNQQFTTCIFEVGDASAQEEQLVKDAPAINDVADESSEEKM